MTRTACFLLLAALLLVATSGPPADAREEAPVVVELFTSQGCNSCPPADAFLGELAGRRGVLPLGFHVTYWDRLGWKDTFGAEAHTGRQHDYARHLGAGRVYTPQMVIGGVVDAVGSNRARVLRAIELLRERGPALALDVVDGGREGAQVRLPAGYAGEADVWLVGFDRAHDVAVERGENRGRVLRYHNVVRDFERLGVWTGEPLELALPLARLKGTGRDGAAVLVQRRRDGAMLGAAALDLRASAV